MRHAAASKRKNVTNAYDREPFSERREHTIASSAYRQAKQRGFFMTGSDVLKSLNFEMDFDEELNDVSFRHNS